MKDGTIVPAAGSSATGLCDEWPPKGASGRGASPVAGNFWYRRREYDLNCPLMPVDDLMPASLTDTQASSDAALAARLACGDCKALEPLYRRHRAALYRFALLWSGQPAVAADVTQDVFVHLLTRAGDFDAERGALLPWLLGIARNLVRRRLRIRDDVPAEEPAELPDLTSAPDAALIAREDIEALRRAITALPPHYRDVIVLVELAERSYAEAAAICGCELNTIRSRLARGRALLAQSLDVGRDARAIAGKAAS